MVSKKIPAITRISPTRVNPFGFHASLSKISEGPIVSPLDIPFAAEAIIAALRVFRLIPPEPKSSRRPKSVANTPSKKVAVPGVVSGFEERNRMLRRWMMIATAREMAIKIRTFRIVRLFMLFRSE
jgi:hypothetical protein